MCIRDRSQAVIWRGPMASKALNQMIFDADWGQLDFMLIDLPPGTGDIHLSITVSYTHLLSKSNLLKMKKLLSIFFIILFFSCSKKSENDLPRLLVPEHENVVEVNCVNMIEFFNYSFLVANITENINLKDVDIEFSKKYNECVQRINLDTILPKYNISVFVDTTYFFSGKGFEYKHVELSLIHI